MLTKDERIAALERVRDDQGGTENKKWKKDQIVDAFTDLRTWLIVLMTLTSKTFANKCLEFLIQPSYLTASIPNGALTNCKLYTIPTALPHIYFTIDSQ